MKRFLSLFLILLLLLSCAACGGRSNAPDDSETIDNTQAGPSLPSEDAPQDTGGVTGEEPTIPPESVPSASTEPVEEEPEERVIDPAKPMVALTFDDGPDEIYTDRILNTFVENNALATFFVVGQMVNAFPDVVARIAEAGCEVGSHSYGHGQLTKLGKKSLREDFEKADAAIKAATGSAPYLIRPPYGSVNSAVASIAGRPMICWNVDTEDWKSRDAQTVIDYLQNYGDLDGDVVLFHSIYESTADAIDVLVPWLQEQGYQLVTVTELMSYYYGEWPQPRTTYWNYFNVTARTDAPLPLPEPGELTAQPEDVPVSRPGTSGSQPTKPADTTTETPPDDPSGTPSEDPSGTPPDDPSGTPTDTPPEDPSAGETDVPPDGTESGAPSEGEGGQEAPPEDGGTEAPPAGTPEDGVGETETDPGTGADTEPGLPDWL